MSIDRRRLYRFPWSKTDNPGGWVDVTDICNLKCPLCYRITREGHRPLADVLADVDACRAATNCDDMKIAGGEPLIYPHLLDVVRHIAARGLKPFLLTNGLGLDRSMALDLARAGLVKFNFHVDSGQNRPGWEGKTEAELNELRQSLADLAAGIRGVGCGFNVTVSPDNLPFLPDVLDWALKNVRIVHHMTLIALRGIAAGDDVALFANGRRLPPGLIPNAVGDAAPIELTTDDILKSLQARFPAVVPAGYLNGSAFPETNKYLVAVLAASRRELFGSLGPKSMEIVQSAVHLFRGRYAAITRRTKVGRKVFALAVCDSEVRRALGRYLRAAAARPWRVFDGIYVQSIALEQPLEIIDGEANVCDDCINMMIYRGRLIPSCRVEEVRTFGSMITAQKIGGSSIPGS
jgi:hypothetical protein